MTWSREQELASASNKTVEAISASLMLPVPSCSFTREPNKFRIVTVLCRSRWRPLLLPQPSGSACCCTRLWRCRRAVRCLPRAYAPHASATAEIVAGQYQPASRQGVSDGVYYGMSPLRLEMDTRHSRDRVKLEGYRWLPKKCRYARRQIPKWN